MNTAKDNGASDAQVSILEVSSVSGTVTFEQLRSAIDQTYRCLSDAGIEYIEEPVDPAAPLPMISYAIGVPTVESDLVSDDCMYKHSFFVESAYQNQPGALDAEEALFTSKRETFIDCLVAAGYEADSLSTNDELKELIVIAMTGSGIGSGDDPPPGFEPVNCLDGTGITGF